MKELDIVAQRGVNQFVAKIATMQKGGNYREQDGTFCRAIINRNTGKRYILQGQLVRCAKSGKFVKLAEVME